MMQASKVLWQSVLWRGLYYVSAFIINILIARHFEASVSGAVYFISSIYALALLVTSLSIESGIIYFAAQQKIPVSKLFGFSLLWSAVVGTLVFLSIFCFYKDDYRGISNELLLFSGVFYITGNLLITYCSGFFYAANHFKTPNLVIVCGTLLMILLIPYNGRSLIPAINNDNYFYVYFGSFFVQGLCIALAAKLTYATSNPPGFLSGAQFKLLIKYSGLAFAGNIIFFLLYRVDYFFVEKFCTPEQLGNYIQVSKLVHLFFILPTILASAVFPITAAGKGGELYPLLTLLSRTLFFLYIVATLVLALAGSWLFPFVFGESFAAMYQPFLWLIPGILALSGIFTLTAYFAGKNRIAVNITGSVYALIIIVVGDLMFIPHYGIHAAAMVSSLGYIVYQLYIISVFKKDYPCSAADFFIFKFSDWKQIRNSVSSLANKSNEKKQ